MNDKDPRVYSVYAYVFGDGHTYVGLTMDAARRDLEHRRNSNGSSVYKYWRESEQEHFPDMTVLYDKLTAPEAQRMEIMFTNAIDPDLRLNETEAGSLGDLLTRRQNESERC